MEDYLVFIKDENGNIREERVRAYTNDLAKANCRSKYLHEGETIMYAVLY